MNPDKIGERKDIKLIGKLRQKNGDITGIYKSFMWTVSQRNKLTNG